MDSKDLLLDDALTFLDRNPVCDIVPNLIKSSLMGKIQDQSVSTYISDSTVCLYSHLRLAFSELCLLAIIAKISYQISWPMSLAPMYEAIRRETSGKSLMREKPAEFLGTGHQCKDDYCHQSSIIFESVETFIRIAGLYLVVVPLTCIPVLSILWLFYSIIHCLICVDTYSLNCIQFLL